MTEWTGVLLQAGTIKWAVGLLVIVGVVIVVLRNVVSSSSGGDSPPETDVERDVDFDFTNEEVQEVLHADNELLENLEAQVDDDLARLIDDGEEESHYAVLDIWWSQVARELGYETPGEDDFGMYLLTLATTSAYENHSDRVGEHPEIESNICGTSPFVVEHRSGQNESYLFNERTESELLKD